MKTTLGSLALLAAVAAVSLVVAAEARAAVLLVRNDGSDAPDCGAGDRPCRSITAALHNAADGDRVVVGPGRYGDLDGDGVSGPGEEVYNYGCSCLVDVDKRVTVESEAGAAATVIEGGGRGFYVVAVTASGAVFGRPGKGFTLTADGGGLYVPQDVSATVAGNHALGNLSTGFVVSGAGSKLVRNVATQNRSLGFSLYGAVTVVGNVAVGNDIGFDVQGDHAVLSRNLASGNTTAGFGVNFGPHEFTGNSAIGNRGPGIWIQVLYGASRITKSNIYGNDVAGGCGLRNSTGGTIDASGNFWGAASGPGDDPADHPCDEGGSITVTSGAATREIAVKTPILR